MQKKKKKNFFYKIHRFITTNIPLIFKLNSIFFFSFFFTWKWIIDFSLSLFFSFYFIGNYFISLGIRYQGIRKKRFRFQYNNNNNNNEGILYFRHKYPLKIKSFINDNSTNCGRSTRARYAISRRDYIRALLTLTRINKLVVKAYQPVPE